MVKNLPAMRETRVWDWEDPLEKGRVIHSSIFTLGIPWIKEPGTLQFMRSQKNWTQLSN